MRSPPLPRGVAAASTALVESLAHLASLQTQRRGSSHAPDAIQTLHRAIKALFELQGGRISVTWQDDRAMVGTVDCSALISVGRHAQFLNKRFGTLGVVGLVFRLIPSTADLHRFLQIALRLRPEHIRALGQPGDHVALPGLEQIGVQLMLDPRGGPILDIDVSGMSGIGVRTALEQWLDESGLSWVGTIAPDEHPRTGQMNRAQKQRLALSTYTNVVTTTQELIRRHRLQHTTAQPLPTLAIHRLVPQMSMAATAAGGHLQACITLGSLDPSPARRIAHTALMTVAVCVQRQLERSTIAEVGLASFLFGLHRWRQSLRGKDSNAGWELLRLLCQEEILTSLKIRATYTAALASTSKNTQEVRIPTATRLIQACAHMAAHLDGTATHDTPLAPIPALAALDAIGVHARQPIRQVLYNEQHVQALAQWFGPLPPGTVIRTARGRTAVICPPPVGQDPHCIALLQADGSPINPPPAPKRLEVQDGRPVGIAGICASRPVIGMASRALFGQTSALWQGLQNPQNIEFTPVP